MVMILQNILIIIIYKEIIILILLHFTRYYVKNNIIIPQKSNNSYAYMNTVILNIVFRYNSHKLLFMLYTKIYIIIIYI